MKNTMMKNLVLALGLLCAVPLAQAEDCLRINSTAMSDYRQNKFTLSESDCQIQLVDQGNQDARFTGLKYNFVLDGKTTTKLPQAFLDHQNLVFADYGVKLWDASYIVRKGESNQYDPDQEQLDIVAYAGFTAKILVPVTITFKIKAEAYVYGHSSDWAPMLSLMVDKIQVQSISGLPDGVAKYVASAIELVLKLAASGNALYYEIR